jgi:hypothetical protein
MQNNLTIAFMLVLLMAGCEQAPTAVQAPTVAQPKGTAFKDPAIRHQLTSMLGELADVYSTRAVPSAIADLDALLSVNAGNFSASQYNNLATAKSELQAGISRWNRSLTEQNEPGWSDAKARDVWDAYTKSFYKAKGCIATAAGSF